MPYAASDAAHSVGQADFQIAIRSIKNSEIAASSALASAKQSFWDGVDADVAKLIESASRDSSTNIQSAASQRIWRKGRPSWAYEAHRRLSQRIKLVNGPWDCWLEWYDARMKGLSDFSLSPQWSEEVSARISNQSDSWWAEGSAYANRHIGSWVQEALRVGGDQNKQTISGFIIEYLDGSKKISSVSDILDAFRDADFLVVPKTVRGELSRLASSGQIKRVSIGGGFYLEVRLCSDINGLSQARNRR